MRTGSVSRSAVFAMTIVATIGIRSQISADVLIDPMRPYTPEVRVERSVGGKAYVLSAILYSTERRIAIVNGRPVSEGQRIHGARVERIEPGKVELLVDGNRLKLVLINDRKAK